MSDLTDESDLSASSFSSDGENESSEYTDDEEEHESDVSNRDKSRGSRYIEKKAGTDESGDEEEEEEDEDEEEESMDYGKSAFIRPSVSFRDDSNATSNRPSLAGSSGVIEDSLDEAEITRNNVINHSSATLLNVPNELQDESMIVRPKKINKQARIIDSESEDGDVEEEDEDQIDTSSVDVKNIKTELKHLSTNSDQDLIESVDSSERSGKEFVEIVDSDNDEDLDIKPWRRSQGAQNLCSTMIENDSANNRLSSVFGGRVIKEELLKPREVHSIASSPSVSSSGIVDIISDSEDEELKEPVKTGNKLKQITLDQMLKQSPPCDTSNVSNVSSNASINKSEVSQEEYQFQKEKVGRMRADFQRLKNLMNTIKLSALPDKGQQLIQSHKRTMEALAEQEDKLNKMTINTSDVKDVSDPLITAPKPASWQDLKNVAAAVQPRTFGTQAMATHNQQKSLTMDRLHQLHSSLKACPTEDTFETDPNGLKVELMMHQKHALAWLLWREKQKPSGGILADDMGLGKTLTMISLVMKSSAAKDDEEEEEGSNDENEDREKYPKRHKYYGGTLIVCPASLISQWDGEIRNRVRRGLLSVELYHGPKRETKSKRLANYDVVITTYAIVMNELEKDTPMFKIKWERIILDEAHQIRNHKSQTSLAVCQLAAKSRWALTGTPIHNKEVDLYSLLKFLRCSPFDELPIFKRWVSDKNTGGQERLNTVMSSLMLRRTKAQLQQKGSLQCLPDRFWEIVEVRLEKEEMDVYQKILIFSKTLFAQFLHQRASKNTDAFESIESTRPTFGSMNDPNSEYHKMHKKLVRLNKMKEVKQHEILVLLLRLRQICCHPSLIIGMLQNDDLESSSITEDVDDVEADAMNLLDQLNKLNLEDEEDPPPVTEFGESVGLAEATRGILKPSNPIFNSRRRSTKVQAVINLLKEKVVDTSDKCIIVSQWTSFLKLLSLHLEEENIIFDQLDGSVPVNKRAVMIDNFNNPAYRAKVLLLSLTAGGVGLNLVGANYLFLLDLHWNPQLEMQAQDRIYRVGQKKPVYVYKFMTMETIEERIKSLQDHKKNLAESVLTGAKMQKSQLSLNDLKMLFEM